LTHTGLGVLRHIDVTGGGASNELAVRIKASVLNHPLRVAGVREATALGAAILGGVGAGIYSDLASAARALRFSYTEILPEPAAASQYERAFRQVYQPLYAALRPLHQRITV
jgi:xylulokinase